MSVKSKVLLQFSISCLIRDISVILRGVKLTLSMTGRPIMSRRWKIPCQLGKENISATTWHCMISHPSLITRYVTIVAVKMVSICFPKLMNSFPFDWSISSEVESNWLTEQYWYNCIFYQLFHYNGRRQLVNSVVCGEYTNYLPKLAVKQSIRKEAKISTICIHCIIGHPHPLTRCYIKMRFFLTFVLLQVLSFDWHILRVNGNECGLRNFWAPAWLYKDFVFYLVFSRHLWKKFVSRNILVFHFNKRYKCI